MYPNSNSASKSTATAKAKTKTKAKASEWDQLKAMMMLSGFGSNHKTPPPPPPPPPQPLLPSTINDQDHQDPPSSPDVGPMPMPASDRMDLDSGDPASDSDDDNDDNDDDDDDDIKDAHTDLASLPLSHTFTLPSTSPTSGSGKPLLCLSCDPSGTRLATGSADHSLRLWDFAGLSATSPHPFKSLDPRAPGSDTSAQPVVDVQWSPWGDSLLVTTAGGCQPQVLSRDGAKVCVLAKGDMYIRDARRTDGHTAGVQAVAWDPLARGRCATAGMDGTVRLWDVAKPGKSLGVIVYARQGAGGRARVAVTCVAYARNGTWVAAGASDGSLRVWKAAGPTYGVPACDIEPLAGTPALVAVEFASDPRVLVARYDDGRVCRWDLAPPASSAAAVDKLVAKLASPAATSPGLPLHAVVGGNVVFSPSDRFVLVGGLDPGATDPRSASGRLLVLDARTLHPVTHVDLDPAVGGSGRVHWSPRTNQVMVATASGACVVMYSDEHSDKGVKLCLGRSTSAGKRTRWVDEELEQVLLERAGAELEVAAQRMAKGKGKGARGSALVQVHGGKISKRQMAALRGEAVPAKHVAERGKLAASASQGGGAIFFAQADAHARPPLDRDVDPREAILKYAEAAAKDPYWITPAYKATQPEAVLAEKVVEEDEEARVIVEKGKEDRQKVLRRRDF